MNNRKILCLLLAAAIGTTVLASCGKEAAAPTQPETSALVEEDGQNPVMNFIGSYRSDRCTLLLEADGLTGAKVTARQVNDNAMATDAAVWELTGSFDETSMRISYTNAVKKLVSYTQTGEISGESVAYRNGSGYIRLNDDGTLTWHDNNDPQLDSRTFDYVYPQDALSQTDSQTLPESQPAAVPAANETTARTTAAAKPTTTATKPATTAVKPATTTTKPATTAAKSTTAAQAAATSAAGTSAASDDGQNPVMNFAGNYQSGRCSLTITPSGKNEAVITATWGNSASSASEWTMHASYNGDTYRLLYGDCVKKTVTYDENGNVVNETVDYTGGVGRLQLFGDGTLRWENEEEADTFSGMIFSMH